MRTPFVQIDPLPDNELETTMKRPAIRIQPVQPRTGNARDQKEQTTAARGSRIPLARGGEPGMTNQERLIAGYQHQLVGSYDEAMQEYRLVIRNSPDLLGEVISNVRALLKLAPKYAPGYRVLGDAYMRQGEYLQAMEAYNKALTIAKKKS
jgi:tetratricopeptide (TPR) repeat protein